MPRVQIRPQAEEDLFQIWHYIVVAHNSPINAAGFIKKLDRQFTTLASSPELGRQKITDKPSVYQFPFNEYFIFYRIIENGVEIIRVLHGRRNVPSII